MGKKPTIEEIVKRKFPGTQVMVTTDAGAKAGRSAGAFSRKAPNIGDLKKRLGIKQQAPSVAADVAATGAARRRAASKAARPAAKKGPSGIVRVMPRTADGGTRRFTKTVIVSKGKVIALQG
jgi:hypothetical protein